MRLPQRSSKAFTLIELIVVIVILGILALIAIPTFGKVIGKSQDEATKTSLRAIGREAQALRALDDASTWGNLPADAISDTSTASGAGLFAAVALKAVASTTVNPGKGEVVHQSSTQGLALSMLSESGRVCILTLTPSVLGDATCLVPTTSNGTNTLGNALSAGTVQVPGGAAVVTYSKPAKVGTVTTVAGDKSASLSWAAPASTATAPVQGYKVYSNGVLVATVPYGTNTYTVSGLTNGTAYTFQVVSYNASVDGDATVTPAVSPAPQPSSFATNGSYSWIVPAGVTKVHVDVYGAAGVSRQSPAGRGGYVGADLTVTPGETLWVNVNYGGGLGGNSGVGGSGGGASDVRKAGNTLNDRLVVAGGGGGGAVWSGGPAGGAGGGLSGANAGGSYAGQGGTQTYGGSPGATDGFSGAAGFGSFGAGGKGGSTSETSGYAAGGGGGGGWYGGGGGTGGNYYGGTSGGGGSSYYDPTRTSNVNSTQGTSSNASVSITVK